MLRQFQDRDASGSLPIVIWIESGRSLRDERRLDPEFSMDFTSHHVLPPVEA
jgi:hypothetical protein